MEFARRCEAASLRWYVLGGTLIGAARHGGFIPWDDDVDVGMPRPDYATFERLAREADDPRVAWQSARTEPAYPFAYGKLVLAGPPWWTRPSPTCRCAGAPSSTSSRSTGPRVPARSAGCTGSG